MDNVTTCGLGESELCPSRVGMGCWAIGGRSWGPIDEAESIAALKQAFDCGITFFDTAPFYGLGHSEKLLGKVLRRQRHSLILATKFGLSWNDGAKKVWNDASPKAIEKEINTSLANLKTDCIDLYQQHWPDPNTPIAETVDALETIKAKGKIRYYGFCNFSRKQLEEVKRYGNPSSLQLHYAMVHRDPENELLPFCRENQLGVIVYSPMVKGLLSGKYAEEPKFGKTDARRRDDRFRGTKFRHIQTALDSLRPIAADNRCSLAQLAIAWVLQNPAVSVAICGAKRAKQVKENVKAMRVDLSEADLQSIGQVIWKYEQAIADAAEAAQSELTP